MLVKNNLFYWRKMCYWFLAVNNSMKYKHARLVNAGRNKSDIKIKIIYIAKNYRPMACQNLPRTMYISCLTCFSKISVIIIWGIQVNNEELDECVENVLATKLWCLRCDVIGNAQSLAFEGNTQLSSSVVDYRLLSIFFSLKIRILFLVNNMTST